MANKTEKLGVKNEPTINVLEHVLLQIMPRTKLYLMKS